jgi:hypothetical protein
MTKKRSAPGPTRTADPLLRSYIEYCSNFVVKMIFADSRRHRTPQNTSENLQNVQTECKRILLANMSHVTYS